MEIESLYTAGTHNDGAEMQVQNENGLVQDCFILLAGMDSDAYQKATKENQRNTLKRMMSEDGDDERDENLELVMRATIGWKGFDLEGKEFDFSKAAARVLYLQAPYIVDQAILFINNRANFTKD